MVTTEPLSFSLPPLEKSVGTDPLVIYYEGPLWVIDAEPERDWPRIIMEGDESVIDLAHGGSFGHGWIYDRLTTFGALPFGIAGGVIGDTLTLPLKGVKGMPVASLARLFQKDLDQSTNSSSSIS